MSFAPPERKLRSWRWWDPLRDPACEPTLECRRCGEEYYLWQAPDGECLCPECRRQEDTDP